MHIYSVFKSYDLVKNLMNLGIILCCVAWTFTKYLMNQYIWLMAPLKHNLAIVG